MTARDRFRLARLRRWLAGPPAPQARFTLPRALTEYVLPPGVSYAYPENPFWVEDEGPQGMADARDRAAAAGLAWESGLPWIDGGDPVVQGEPLLPVPDPVVVRHGDAMSVHWPAIRTLWWLDPRVMDGYSEPGTLPEGVTTEPREVAEIKDANLISSRLTDGFHSPVLDIDYGARLIPSSTPGHFHLYLDDLRLTWDEYEELLLVLARLGVIEPGYAAASIDRRQTMVRKPGVTKPPPEPSDVELATPAPQREYWLQGDPRRRSNPAAEAFVAGFVAGTELGPLFQDQAASALDNWVSMGPQDDVDQGPFPADTDSITFATEDPPAGGGLGWGSV